MKTPLILATAALLGAPAVLDAQILITEWMYNGSEFVEFTNVGSTAVDMTGWSFDDSSATAGAFDLSAFGTVAAGQSVILAEVDAAAFRTEWSLDSSVVVIGLNDQNLGRGDVMNLFNASSVLVDTLAYDDQGFAGSIRTNGISGWTTPENLGDNNVFAWVLSTVGDLQGSYTSVGGYVGNPGTYSAVPEPATWAVLLGSVALVGAVVRRRGRR